jgi:NADH-quinone oxidoreductase subunit F
MSKLRNFSELEKIREDIAARRDTSRLCITVCGGTGCAASGAISLLTEFEKELKKEGLRKKVDLRQTGCHGFCEQGPIVVIYPRKIFYQRVEVDDVKEIVANTIKEGKVVERLLYADPASSQKIIYEDDVPFYKKQFRLIFGNNGRIDPASIEDYLFIGGYQALSRVLSKMRPDEVIAEIKKSGLRGRGGAGFPTGRKWESCRNAHGDEKFIICNADEGDPGAYVDRSLLEGNPHSVLEGMTIGAYAVGARQAYIYVRNEYPMAVKNARLAIHQAEELGLLGDNILGSGFSLRININRGGGAFVCGESSALMASIEGRVGEPRQKYVHATESGLWNKPTVLNNVKTWATVPVIINRGAEWFASIGTQKSKGTMVFSLVGKINNTGLVEVPMGITLRSLIYDIGGGIPMGKRFKAVQTGGPSGGCIPEKLLDLPVDYERLNEAGSMMGSGGMIVMDEDTCMVNVAKYFLSFSTEESCGKCVPCREGTRRMHEILTRITSGEGKYEDMEILEELARGVSDTSLCALGTTAPNPVLTTLEYFRDEYRVHIKDKKCPSKVCKHLIRYFILKEKCTGCTACAKACPQQAITGEKKNPHLISQELCVKCGICRETCKFSAVIVE